VLDERLLQILVCPACRTSLDYKERRKVLICTECATRYEVRDGIPIMLPPGGGTGAATEPVDAESDAQG
jgi:uncharacterized protein YbaR (Trm112 family)